MSVTRMSALRILIAAAAALAATLPLAGCGGNSDDLPAWTEQQRREVKPSVQPLQAPKRFDPQAYLAAAARLGCEPARTLFIDHLFRNVQGARTAGLHADTAWHAQSLRRVLRRYQLLG